MNIKNLNMNMTTSMLLQLVNIGYGILLPRIIIISYGSEMNGLVSATLQLIGYMKIVEAGLSTASIRQFYDPLVKKDSKKISDLFQSINYYYKKIANYFIVLSLICALVYALIVNTNVSNLYVFLLVSVISLSTYLDFSFGIKFYIYFLANKEVYKYQLAQIISQVVKISITLMGVYFNIDLILLMLFLSLIVLIKVYILTIFFKREKININSKYQFIKIDQRDSVLTHQILGLVIYNGPVILISILIDPIFASVFAIYSLIFGTFYGFYSLIYGQTLLPQLGHTLSEGKKDNVKVMHEKYNKYSILVNLVIMITTIIMFESFIELYTYGADINYYRYTTATLFLGYTFINCLKVPYQTLVNANGDFKKTIVHSVIEVLVFILTIVSLYKMISIDTFVLALLLSSLYKMVSLKIFTNIYIVKESWKQHYFQLISIFVLIIIIRHLTTIYYPNINSIMDWIINSIFIVLVTLILSFVIIILPDKVIDRLRALKMNYKE
ncbi:hypothetical protein LAV79_02080 [Peribacillus butanolivorans]|uniref:hypothetical protein n=1 Tax=Peribacillus butanolivorans TaxID=421767 RepID=UPI0030C9E355